jgi:hypothetical protein
MDNVQVKTARRTELPRFTPELGAEVRADLIKWGGSMYDAAVALRTSTGWLEKICEGTAGVNPALWERIHHALSPAGQQESPTARRDAFREARAEAEARIPVSQEQMDVVASFIEACGGVKMAAKLAGVSPATMKRYAAGPTLLPLRLIPVMCDHLTPAK